MAQRSDARSTFHVLEITIISAQDLKSPSNSGDHPTMKAYAVVWVDPSTKLRTLTDSVSGGNPTWNEKFLFRVPPAFLMADSSSAIHVEIYAVGRILDSLVGAVRFLVGNQRLLDKPLGEPSFVAVGIRRPSGRFRGVLNIGSALLPNRHVSVVAEQAIARSGGDATGYRALMGEGPKVRRLPKGGWEAPGKTSRRDRGAEALKERNKGDVAGKSGKKEKWAGSNGKGGFCGLAFQRRNLQVDQNSSPSRRWRCNC